MSFAASGMDPVNAIETDRWILRTWKDTDLLPFSMMNQDPQVMEFFPAPLSDSETAALMQTIVSFMDQRGFGLFAAETKDTHEFMGFIGFNEPSFSSYFTPCIEIGWRPRSRFWSQGFATEGAKACLTHGFSNLGFDEVVAFTTKMNEKSIHVMKKLGMTYDGEFEHPNLEAGHRLRTHVLYRISRNKYSHESTMMSPYLSDRASQ